MHGCGDGGGGSSSTALSVTDLVGTYDATLVGSAGASGGIGVFGPGNPSDGTVAITIYDSSLRRIRVSGPIDADGSMVLAGQQRSANLQALVTGTANVATDGTQLIGGSLELVNGTSTFTLERPASRDLRGFSGLYTFVFSTSPGPCQCATSAAIDLQFAADGSGSAGEAREVDAGGTEVGRFQAAVAFVSPTGRLVILGTDLALNTPTTVWLTGVVTVDGRHAAGSGEFSRDTDPIVIGPWTATR
jgi:hypothetical protein